MTDARHDEDSTGRFPPIPNRSALHEAREALELAELVRIFRRLDRADRAHILKLSGQLADWHY
jgi:hypothetical protein